MSLQDDMAEVREVVDDALKTTIDLTRDVIAKTARSMADDMERQGLPTTGPEALRLLARALERTVV